MQSVMEIVQNQESVDALSRYHFTAIERPRELRTSMDGAKEEKNSIILVVGLSKGRMLLPS